MSTALLLLGAAGVAEGGSSGNLTPATLVRYQRVGEIIWQGYTNFQKSGSHQQILGFIWVT